MKVILRDLGIVPVALIGALILLPTWLLVAIPTERTRRYGIWLLEYWLVLSIYPMIISLFGDSTTSEED